MELSTAVELLKFKGYTKLNEKSAEEIIEEGKKIYSYLTASEFNAWKNRGRNRGC